MRLVAYFLGAVCVVAGIGLAVLGVITPFRYSGELLSAIQMTQVYAEADHYVLLSIAAFTLAVVFTVTGNGESKVDTEAIENLLKLQINMAKKRELEKGVPKSFVDLD